MIKVFIPQDKTQGKTNIRGLWLNKDKIYYDYLKVVNTSFIEGKQLEALKKKYNQQAIFYVDTATDTGIIYYNKDKKEVLSHRIYAMIGRNFRAELKEDLKIYGGVTIYKIGAYYCKEIFYK